MDQATFIGILELTSIVVAAGLGVAGTVTETKNEKGQLTKWGAIAVVGVVLSNAFTFVQSYLEQKRSLQEEIAQMEAMRMRDSIQRVEYLEQMNLLYHNISKSDSSLKQQLLIQSQTTDVLGKMDKSLTVQSSILQQSAELNRLQKEAAEKIDQTLNPIFPMRMDLTLELRSNEKTPALSWLTSFIRANYASISSLPDSAGLKRDFMRTGNWVSLSNAAKRQYLREIESQTTGIQFDRQRTDGGKETMYCFVPDGYFNGLSHAEDVTVTYNLDGNYYEVQYSNLPVRMVDRRGTGFKSTSQLPDSRMTLIITRVPGEVVACRITYKFPPDFSVIHKLQANGAITNLHAPLLGPYILQYITESVKYAE